jgi:hypothetical protein
MPETGRQNSDKSRNSRLLPAESGRKYVARRKKLQWQEAHVNTGKNQIMPYSGLYFWKCSLFYWD